MLYKKLFIFLTMVILGACSPRVHANPTDFNKYWFDQGAEINRFELRQARYGEMREGEMTMIFVTEPFNLNKQVKSDKPRGENVKPILKLIFSRDFNTGVYPYSVMTSVFTLIDAPSLPLKLSFSAQEWCGMVYQQLNQRKKTWLSHHYSYFESEGDKELSLDKVFTEDGIFNLIRLDPQKIPVGDFLAIPSLWFIRSQHLELKNYRVVGEIKHHDKVAKYTLTYPELDRELVISYATVFPHRIISWEETYFDGWGDNRQKLTTRAKNVMTRMLPYWEKNTTADEDIRKKMGYR